MSENSVELTIFYGNIHGQRRIPIYKIIREYNPDILALTEAYRIGRFARTLKNYILVQPDATIFGSEAKCTALLIRKDIHIESGSWASIRMKEYWFGPFRLRKRNPRVHQKIAISKKGKRAGIFMAFFPTGGPSGGRNTKGKNSAAWHESAERAHKFFDHRPETPAILLGDLNCTHNEAFKYLRPPVYDTWTVSTGKVDHLIAKNVEHVSFKRLRNPRGMHGWGIYTVRL